MDEGSGELYLLDANVFIEAYRRYYGLDLCPGFWESIAWFSEQGRVTSIDRVRREIQEGDALDAWMKQAPESLFASTADEDVVEVYQQMMDMVQQSEQYLDRAKAEFAAVADGWLVAFAVVNGATVITHEVRNPAIRKKVPIPNIADEFDVACADTFEMLQSLEVRFGWLATE